ncbi:MAG: acyl-CoA dehydrogenase family protein [Dehalococcoidia bacterium]|nr:acyl-CoA dehydrogenase family protein [Dehalococcoidia bacterium]
MSDANGYTEAQLQIQRMVREFSRKEVAPGAEERDRESRFDYELYRRLGGLGLPGMLLPEQFAGSDTDALSFCLALEEMSRVDMSLALTMWVGIQGAQSMAHGTDEQIAAWRGKYIEPTARGEMVSAGAITEPDAGSDTAALKTRAVADGDEWVINGSKIFISNAGLEHCGFAMVLCRTDEGYGIIIVPTGTPGYTMGPPLRKMGLRSSDTRELSFDDCRVPALNLLGGRGSGREAIITGGFYITRLYLGSQAIGVAAECLDLSLAYAKRRIAFKRPIARFEYVQGMLVEMALEVELGRLLRDKACRMHDAHQYYAKEAAMTKLFCTEMAKRAADHAVQVFGGAGYMDETPVSRYYRDIRAATIAEGTSEVQKYIIAREMGCFQDGG